MHSLPFTSKTGLLHFLLHSSYTNSCIPTTVIRRCTLLENGLLQVFVVLLDRKYVRIIRRIAIYIIHCFPIECRTISVSLFLRCMNLRVQICYSYCLLWAMTRKDSDGWLGFGWMFIMIWDRCSRDFCHNYNMAICCAFVFTYVWLIHCDNV